MKILTALVVLLFSAPSLAAAPPTFKIVYIDGVQCARYYYWNNGGQGGLSCNWEEYNAKHRADKEALRLQEIQRIRKLKTTYWNEEAQEFHGLKIK